MVHIYINIKNILLFTKYSFIFTPNKISKQNNMQSLKVSIRKVIQEKFK